jgi:beta-lactamase class C
MYAAMRGVHLHQPADAGFDADQLRRAFGLLEEWTEADVIPGAGALVARGGWIVGEAYVGVANRSEGRPVKSSTVWSLASVTKPFTATAVMRLVEQGLFSLDEPLCKLVPEFMDAPEMPFDRRRVTLRHVLAHCSGLPGFSEDNLAIRKRHEPLEGFFRSFARQPLLFEPGTAHFYSNPGILVAAEVAARALDGTLGQRLPVPAVRRLLPYIGEEILAPLGMKWSTLLPPEEWNDRIAWVERSGQEGTDWEGANSAYYRSLGIPWGGLFSRPRELARFVDLFLPLAGGRQRIGAKHAGAQIVSPATAAAMTNVQFAPPDAPADLAPGLRDGAAQSSATSPIMEWGIGWSVKGAKRPHFTGELTSPATYGHRGATGTMVWADPETDAVCILLTNRTLVSGWTSERPRQAMFSNAVVAALR